MRALLIVIILAILALVARADQRIRYEQTPGNLHLEYTPPIPGRFYVWVIRDIGTGALRYLPARLNALGDMTLDLETNQWPGQQIFVQDWGPVILVQPWRLFVRA